MDDSNNVSSPQEAQPSRSPPQLRRKPKMDRLSPRNSVTEDGNAAADETAAFTTSAEQPPRAVTPNSTTSAAVGSATGTTTNTIASSSSSSSPSPSRSRNPPYLPTPREALVLGVFPLILAFGALFSLFSPLAWTNRTNAAETGTAHFSQAPGDAATLPTYFARKSNVFNVYFVKRGWFWISVAFGVFVSTHPVFVQPVSAFTSKHRVLGRRASAVVRWGLVTLWWFLVTQWFFGPPLTDRSFRMTGGSCVLQTSNADDVAVTTSARCKTSGGSWSGGHDISGHVFLLVLGGGFLLQEVGWVLRNNNNNNSSGRTVVMTDGAVKAVEVEAVSEDASTPVATSSSSAISTLALRFVGAVLLLSLWMLLMTAIYFHTWLEKMTGLLTALVGLYAVYIVPRFVPAVRRVVGVPGV